MPDDIITIQNGPLAASIATGYGNIAFSFTSNAHEILWTPAPIDQWPTNPAWRDRPPLGGIPLLAPWANRLDSDAYFANGKRYLLNPDLLPLRRDANGLPMHGFLAFCDGWRVIKQDASSVTSRLEFWRQPEWMVQFPFAHALEITHRLDSGMLEVETAIENLSTEPMPLCIGFHPYFQLTDSPRDEWRLRIPARESVILSDTLVPTGETTPCDLPQPFPLARASLDAVFTGLTGDDFVAEGRSQRISVHFGPKFPVAIVYAPPGQSLFCFEPMTALTNAFNLDHTGKKSALQHIAPGETWRESFWIHPEGF
jgi:aldose 1-epimerase